jgi:hypothetical protein
MGKRTQGAISRERQAQTPDGCVMIGLGTALSATRQSKRRILCQEGKRPPSEFAPSVTDIHNRQFLNDRSLPVDWPADL